MIAKDFKINNTKLLNLVFAFFPISLILGNLVTNLNILLFCCLGIFYLKSHIIKTKFDFPIKIIFLLFILIFFSTFLSFIQSLYFGYYDDKELTKLTKSLLFFRYFLMLIIVYLLNKFNFLNFNNFFIAAAFSGIIVSIDVIYQYIFGYNIIGLKSHGHHNSSFFGDELIAGGFIQNFSMFSILACFFLLRDIKKINFIIVITLVCILGFAILVSGNRMSMLLFILGLFLLFLFSSKLRLITVLSFVILSVVFKFSISSDTNLEIRYKSFYDTITGTISSTIYKMKNISKKESKNASKSDSEDNEGSTYRALFPSESSHKRLFLAAIDTWAKNKIFGNGIKSFREDCKKLEGPEYNLTGAIIKSKKNRLCSSHPHNYYVEILTETGIVGFSASLITAFLFLFFIYNNFKYLKEDKENNLILLAAVISLFVEMFPFKSTGSIFTTNNTTYIILMSSMVLSYKKLLNFKN